MRVSRWIVGLLMLVSSTGTYAMPGKHLSCHKEKDESVEKLIEAIEASNTHNIILYYHGGLSSTSYMKDNLGPWLDQSIFANASIDGFFPIYMNYDASLFSGDNLKKVLQEIAESAFFKDQKDKFFDKVKAEIPDIKRNEFSKSLKRFSNTGTYTGTPKENAAYYLLTTEPFGLKRSISKSLGVAKDEEYFMDIYASNELALQHAINLLNDEEFASIAEGVAQSLSLQPESYEDTIQIKSRQKSLLNLQSAISIAIVKSLARLAIGSNHDVFPTFEEELFAAFKIYGVSITGLAREHWQTVDEHAKQCSETGTNGRALLDYLVNRKTTKADVNIHLMSHSAGSIPIAYAVSEYKNNDNVFNTIQLIVPAVSQEKFKNLMYKNKDVFHTLKIYVLDEKSELEDDVVKAYTASLLYFVSGVAAKTWFHDKMLLLNQHLDETRRPYDWDKYRGKWFMDYNPSAVQQYLTSEIVNYYPSSFVSKHPGLKEANNDTHECTKYPWVGQELAKTLLMVISGKSYEEIPVVATPHDVDAVDASKACLKS